MKPADTPQAVAKHELDYRYVLMGSAISTSPGQKRTYRIPSAIDGTFLPLTPSYLLETSDGLWDSTVVPKALTAMFKRDTTPMVPENQCGVISFEASLATSHKCSAVVEACGFRISQLHLFKIPHGIA